MYVKYKEILINIKNISYFAVNDHEIFFYGHHEFYLSIPFRDHSVAFLAFELITRYLVENPIMIDLEVLMNEYLDPKI